MDSEYINSGFQRPFKHTSRYKIRNGPLKERYKGILDGVTTQ